MNPTATADTEDTRDDYDGAWKEVIEHYLPDFFAFFFKAAFVQIDWHKGYEFLDQELRSLTPQSELGKRVADKLIRVYLLTGEEHWVYLHIEVQTSYQAGLSKRVFVYNYRIFDKFDRPVSSFVILADDRPGWNPDCHEYETLGTRLRLEYQTVKLLRYTERMDELLASDNPFAQFTAIHLQTRKTRNEADTRYQVKRNFIKHLTGKGWSNQRIHYLIKELDNLMNLPPELNQKLWGEFTANQEVNVMGYLATLEHDAIQRGMERGMVQGEYKLLKKQMEKRFGPLPESINGRLSQATAAELETWGEAVLTATSLDSIFQNRLPH